VPVLTTVHPLQVVRSFPTHPHDLPVAFVVTPDEVIRVDEPPLPPSGIDWGHLPDEAYQEMPLLAELRALKQAT
jgi:5-formyltetrahydrofolate cyclo-ligase